MQMVKQKYDAITIFSCGNLTQYQTVQFSFIIHWLIAEVINLD